MKVKYFLSKAKRREETVGRFLTGFKADLPDDDIREKPWNASLKLNQQNLILDPVSPS